ncbi:hypothetical protein HUJ04_013251 [Dendroctonus ponderosae]
MASFKLQTMSCPLASRELFQSPICRWTGTSQMVNGHLQEHTDLVLEPLQFEWPEIGQNKVFFSKVDHHIVTVAIKYQSENKFLCHASINDTELETLFYKYELELTTDYKLSSIIFRGLRLQSLPNMSHDFNTPTNRLQVDIQHLPEMIRKSKKIIAIVRIVRMNGCPP